MRLWLGVMLALAGLAGCTSTPVAPVLPPVSAEAAPRLGPAGLPAPQPEAQGRVGGAGKDWLVYLPAAGDTLEGIAQRYLGSPLKAWQIAQANAEAGAPEAGRALRVPLTPPPPWGVSREGLQTVTVLCYHRFAAGKGPTRSKMILAADDFEAQLMWLQRERYRALRTGEFQAFIEGREAVPPRSVMLTVDDGFATFFEHAFPLLKKYQVPVTLFIFTDVIGLPSGLSWQQLRELARSGLVDIQAHSRTHRNLTELQARENDVQYRRNLQQELRHPRAELEKQLGMLGVKVQHFAYPYGASNDKVIDALNQEGYALGFTVRAGGNAFYEQPQLIRRTMIYGDQTLDEFTARVQASRPLSQP
ncbi:MAG: hypothetical protein EOP39_20080 [Rubrivivax sp.]|nr:MAG: hypothetical protein EOP39_20080 [Rubrivivax sp.]